MKNWVEVIDLWPITEECRVCGEVSYKSGIPVFEGMVLPSEWRDQWGGVPACDRCRRVQESLTRPVEMEEFRKLVEESE